MRLAYERGLLKQRGTTRVQQWALLYWIYLDRRTRSEDKRSELIQQTLNLAPDRWLELGYRDEMLRQVGLNEGDLRQEPEEQPFTPEDEESIEQFMRQQDAIAAKRWINAGMLPPDFVPDTEGTRV